MFPATIRGVRLVRSGGGRTELEIEHRDGTFPNVLIEVGPQRVDLWEVKPRYEGRFENRFEAVSEGTRHTVVADIRLRGAARLLAPLLGGYIRRRIVRFVLLPMRRAAAAG